MSNLKFWTSSESSTVLTRGQRKTPNGALMAANTRAQAELGLPSDAQNQDVRGQTLRLLRMQQNWDPASLATQACISLRQLYQLEGGETSLFYSKSLRNQAGRRVATILGARWDELEQPPAPAIPDKHIKLVSTTAPQTPTVTPLVESSSPATATAAAPTMESPSPVEMPMGLDKPAVDTLVVPTPVMAQISRPEPMPTAPPPSSRKLHPLWTFAGWLLAAGAGAGTGWAWALLGPVRL